MVRTVIVNNKPVEIYLIPICTSFHKLIHYEGMYNGIHFTLGKNYDKKVNKRRYILKSDYFLPTGKEFYWGNTLTQTLQHFVNYFNEDQKK